MAVISRRSGAYAVALVAIAACVAALVSLAPSASEAATTASVGALSCSSAPAAGHVACLSTATRLTTADAGPAGAQGYGPGDLDSLYDLPAAVRHGAPSRNTPTVAVIDVGHDLHAASDLAAYRAYFKLPACTKASGCFSEVNEHGSTTNLPAMSARDDWGGEISLDLDMVSAICPACNLLLVDAASTASDDLVAAAQEATAYANHGRPAHYVSMSFGGSEPTGSGTDSELDPSNDPFLPTNNAVYVAATGDCGYRPIASDRVLCTDPRSGESLAGASWPAVLPTVVGTGGVTAAETGSGTSATWSLSAWNGSGSGCATGVPATAVSPVQQAAVTTALAPTPSAVTECQGRATSDLSAIADNNDGVLVYYTSSYAYGSNAFEQNDGCTPKGTPDHCLPWEVAGGTSAAAPQVAAMYALAGDVSTPDAAVQELYQNAATVTSDFVDITSGSTEGCRSTDGALCKAGTGWDGPTGLGIPSGLGAFTATGAAPGTFTATQVAAISGKAKVGDVLRASAGTVVDATTNAPVTGATSTLQWMRGRTPIPGATRATYKLVKADKGHKITVRVTVAATDYVPFSDSAPATAAVRKKK